LTAQVAGPYISAFARSSPIDTTVMTKPWIRSTLATAVGGAALCALALAGCTQQKAGGSSQPRAVKGYVAAVEAKQRGDTAGAIRSLEDATQANPDLTMARDMLGDLYRAGGQYEKATVQYEALVQLDPYTALNHYKLGVSYHFLQRLQEAATSTSARSSSTRKTPSRA
jgi:tetratricopeptide (TPR) repeat protein